MIDEILLQVTNQNDDSEETEELEQQEEDDCDTGFGDENKSDEEGEQG